MNETKFKIFPPLIIGHLFNLEIIINKRELKIHYGTIKEIKYLLYTPTWTIQYIKVDSEALSLPPRGKYVEIERFNKEI
ncbi:Galectin [Meloidogyne graminicola]|uniref:Galectin n=1 Tax=Meloidogyne graminicola TaxID=189291 RepID=A0A8S9ZSF2_9BILA|nr:Galectin [Meloidogyne graminicola]